jgi:23S rRNA A2030 N6-methylase RlmJ
MYGGHLHEDPLIKITNKALEELDEIMEEYFRKFDKDIALLDRYDMRGRYDFMKDNARMEEELQEEITEMTEKLADIVMRTQEKSEE